MNTGTGEQIIALVTAERWKAGLGLRFEDTDSPLGQMARDLLAKVQST